MDRLCYLTIDFFHIFKNTNIVNADNIAYNNWIRPKIFFIIFINISIQAELNLVWRIFHFLLRDGFPDFVK